MRVSRVTPLLRLIGETESIRYERLWGSEQSQTSFDRVDPFFCVPRDRDSWICLAEGWRYGWVWSDWRFHSDRDLSDRSFNLGVAREVVALPAGARLFRDVCDERKLRPFANNSWRFFPSDRTVHARNHA